MLQLLFIFLLSPFWGSRSDSLQDCQCPNISLSPDNCALGDEAVLMLEEDSKMLNISQEVMVARLNEIMMSLEDQRGDIDVLSKKLNRISLANRWLSTSNEQLGRSAVNTYRSCSEAYTLYNLNESKIYQINPHLYKGESFNVWCTMDGEYGGGWTRILHRSDASVSFNNTFWDYESGFGEVTNFFIGLDKLHAMTTENPQSLLIILKDETRTRYAEYAFFAIGDQSEQYSLKVLGNFRGSAGDSMRHLAGQKFYTYAEVIQKENLEEYCRESFSGGWWHNLCYKSNLNGHYYAANEEVERGAGIVWETMISKSSSLMYAEMLIRKAEHAGCFLTNF